MLRLSLRPLIFLSLTAAAFAQGPPAPVAATSASHTTAPAGSSAADRFAAEPFVILNRHSIITMQADGSGVREQTLAVRIQSDAALRQLGVLAIPFAASAEHIEFVYVRVRRPDGSVLPTATADALDEPLPVTREAPFYSDLKQKELPIRSLRVGDTLEWQARVVRTKPEAPHQFWDSETFAKDAVILAEDLEVRTPANLAVTFWTNPAMAAPTVTTERAERVTTWHHVQLTPTVGAAAEATKKAKETHVLTPAEELDATEGSLPDLAYTTFPSWSAVGAWYRGMEGTRAMPDDAVRAKVAELTAGKATQEEKAHALYSYVATQIRYIGVAFGIGRYQPHTAAEVLANQYGDCKDKHTLLAAMLAAVGIQSDAVLIGAGVRFNEAVPSPAAFNHLITRAHLDGKEIFLDTTAEVAPWGELVPIIRDHTALVVPDAGTATLVKTPAGVPFKAFATFKVVGSLTDDLTSDSQIEATYRDDDELGLRAVLHQVTAAQYTEFGQRLMAGMGFGGTVSDVEIRHADDTTQPIVLAFHYHRVKPEDWGANRITATFLFLTAPAVDDQHPPVSSLLLGLPRTETSSVQMKLPVHWTAELPEAIHAHAAFADCDVTFRLEAGKGVNDAATLFEERRYTVLKEKVALADLKAYKSWYTTCGAGSVPYVQLVHNGTGSSTVHTAPSNAEAARLIVEANDTIKDKQTDKARELLDSAKRLNPEQRELWGSYGYRAYMLGMTNEAIDDYRKEIALHPDTLWPYAPLAEELSRSGRYDEAISTLHTAIAQDPSNARNQLMLVTLLYANGDAAGAIRAGTEAEKHIAGDATELPGLQIAVATAQVSAGDMAPAAEMLVTALKTATTTDQKNSLAYLLAETGLQLPEAEAAERSALEELYTQSRNWTLDEAAATLQQTSGLIAASWDTLGYIYLREGKLAEARSYIEAAWRTRHDLEIGEHLGAVELAQHQPEAAAATLQLALSTVMTPHARKLPPNLVQAANHARAELDQARKAGAKATIKDPHAALQALRTIVLGPAHGVSGSAEYRLLLGPAKVADTDTVVAFRPVHNPLTNADALLHAVTLTGFLPAGADARIVVSGFVNCVAVNGTCEFIVPN